jgi:hypothetical protein
VGEVANISDRSLLETQAKRWLARLVRLVAWGEPLESIKSFLEVLTPCVANKLEKELPESRLKNRVDNLEKRAFRWLERSFWNDISRHPGDPLDKRTLRLKKIFETTPAIPRRRGDSKHFPISVFIEYDSLVTALKPAFKRRPAEITKLPKEYAREFVNQTIGRGRGYRRPLVLHALNTKRLQRWETKQLESANRVIPIDVWQKGQEFWFDAEDILNLTSRDAALKILGTKLKLSSEQVSKLVKKGKNMLPRKALEKMETAFASMNDATTRQFLNHVDPLE